METNGDVRIRVTAVIQCMTQTRIASKMRVLADDPKRVKAERFYNVMLWCSVASRGVKHCHALFGIRSLLSYNVRCKPD